MTEASHLWFCPAARQIPSQGPTSSPHFRAGPALRASSARSRGIEDEHRDEVKAGNVLLVSSGCSESPVVPQLVIPALVCPSSRTCPAPVVMSRRGWSTAGDSSFPEMIPEPPGTHKIFRASQICIHIYKSHLRLSSEMRFVLLSLLIVSRRQEMHRSCC